MRAGQRMRSRGLTWLLCLLAAASLLPGTQGAGAWSGYPDQNTPVCTSPGSQVYPCMVSDGSGGAVIAWQGARSGNDDLYAQRVDSEGALAWAPGGLAVCTAPGSQSLPQAAGVAPGETVIAWQDSRGDAWDIYAQRLGPDGAPAWAADGAPVCSASGDQKCPQVVPDGSGGAIIAWQDGRSDNWDIYAQRLDSEGALAWAAGGVAVCTVSFSQSDPRVIPDGAGGAIIAWQDGRNGHGDIYAQRLDSEGAPRWAAGGVAVCAEPGDQTGHRMAPDGSGGAIVAWSDGRGSTGPDIYAQRVDSSGALQWAPGGLAVCTAPADQLEARVAPDGSGGAVVTWYDLRRGAGWEIDIYAQRVDSGGAVGWAADGVRTDSASFSRYGPDVVPDGSGGAIVAWPVERSGSGYDIYAQRLDSGGAPRWAAGGAAVCTAPGIQESPRMVPDGSGGAIVAWVDGRSSSSGHDIYADRVDADGHLTDTERPSVALTSAASPATDTYPIAVTATFSEAVAGFTLDSIAVANGDADNLTAASSAVYTFGVTPRDEGPVTIGIGADAARDAAGLGNTAAAQLAVTFTPPPPTITSYTATRGQLEDLVVINGTGFFGVTGVAFGDSETLSFTVESATRITAGARHGAGGRISVATPRGTATSSTDYVAPEPPPIGTNWALVGTVIGTGVLLSAIVGWLVMSRRRG